MDGAIRSLHLHGVARRVAKVVLEYELAPPLIKWQWGPQHLDRALAELPIAEDLPAACV
jgi:hypothetical protein